MRTPTIAHTLADDVQLLIDGYTAGDGPRLHRKHTRDAQRITSSHDLQPRLVDVHRQAHSMAVRLTALKDQATALGLITLADQIDSVSTAVHDLMTEAAAAAVATTSGSD
ncbi:hypothetical protein GCM10010377_68750 [Streptomyces viridiviolaceus]|uniref:Uncharacterized protein n=1 Tax=Streptomyces viridiviolaceus TaxID=68282 RepID=A0ABW2EB56_9ACTN|nr:hypothetical protein [Streptomyces viridiviolaceus]GHB68084.1 hypothetical protein GCM10010377_68750 [Streptomyces viridiviolaceus]